MYRALTAVALGIILASPAQAAPELRPGLWEHTMEMKGGMQEAMQQMQKQLENMPPAQRKRMEQMMQGQGIPFANGPQTFKTCLSEETAKRGYVPDKDGRCQHEITEEDGNTLSFEVTCKGNPPSTGHGTYTYHSPTSFSGKSVITTTANGRNQTTTITQSGKWLSSDCGGRTPR
jgi:hypothetical protein